MKIISRVVIVLLVFIAGCATAAKGVNNDNVNNTSNVNNINNINNTTNTNNNTNNTNNTTNNCTTDCDDGTTKCEDDMLQVCGLVDGCYEWIDNTDCSGTGGICQYNGTTGDAECAGQCSDLCDTEGDLRCDDNKIQICSLTEGCLDWVEQTDCTTDTKVCEINTETSVPECVYNCSDVCTTEFSTQCSNNFIQTCVEQTNGCLDWEDTLNCSTDTCQFDGTTATCEEPGTTVIYFSEYLEGSSFNKALEIYFRSVPTLYDTSNCEVRLYMNGNSTFQSAQLDSTQVNSGDLFVLCGDSFVLSGTVCDQYSPNIEFNGDDAVELVCGSVTYDIIGQIGTDPGTQWISGTVSTLNMTLRRLQTVTQGDTNGTDEFIPDVQWTSEIMDTYIGLGLYPDPL